MSKSTKRSKAFKCKGYPVDDNDNLINGPCPSPQEPQQSGRAYCLTCYKAKKRIEARLAKAAKAIRDVSPARSETSTRSDQTDLPPFPQEAPISNYATTDYVQSVRNEANTQLNELRTQMLALFQEQTHRNQERHEAILADINAKHQAVLKDLDTKHLETKAALASALTHLATLETKNQLLQTQLQEARTEIRALREEHRGASNKLYTAVTQIDTNFEVMHTYNKALIQALKPAP